MAFSSASDNLHFERLVDACAVVGITLDTPLPTPIIENVPDPFACVYHCFAVECAIKVCPACGPPPSSRVSFRVSSSLLLFLLMSFVFRRLTCRPRPAITVTRACPLQSLTLCRTFAFRTVLLSALARALNARRTLLSYQRAGTAWLHCHRVLQTSPAVQAIPPPAYLVRLCLPLSVFLPYVCPVIYLHLSAL